MDHNLPIIIAQWVADESSALAAAYSRWGGDDPVVFVETVAVDTFKELYSVEDIYIAMEDYRVVQYIELLFWRRSDKDSIH